MTRRRGFTLIEVLTVIAIIIILVGIVVFGLGKVMGGTKEKATQNTLENLRSMLSEYEVVSKGLKRQPPMQWWNNAPTKRLSIWQDANPDDATGNAPEPDPARAPANVTKEAGTGINGRYSAEQIGNTQQVLILMQQAPSVRTMMQQLPAQQLMEELPAGLVNVKLQVQQAIASPDTSYKGTAARPTPALVLDGWGNPIIFVPSGGLAGETVAKADPTAMIIGGKATDDDSKRVLALDPAAPTPADAVRQIRSPDNRPFWTSAGPDGNFLTADDNVYSFEN